ncbi:ROK family protein [Phycicoccus sp. 3266]|uniref:ROK family protein n=1 Tax=Phycicoccus sp. 3266 TaxID=2817751 RepID=UPI00285B9E3C|nr:ROK family protein [Phycicoccus sp. 3266]MDR6861748.1 putative NBD/HSP70 family sugar kinase [Phycicoccus sp. 3266]
MSHPHAPGGRRRRRPAAGATRESVAGIRARGAGGQAAGLVEPRQAELFSLALRFEPVTRAQLAAWTGLDASTVTRSLRPLIDDGYLRESGPPASGPTAGGRGRPVQSLSVNPARHVAVGVKLGPSLVSAVCTDLRGTVLGRHEARLGSTEPTAVLDTISTVVGQLVDSSRAAREDVLGVGVGLSGHVDRESGTCRLSAILGWRDVAVRDPLADRLGLPVTVQNDANTLALAEHWFGRGRGARTLAVVTLGIGIGCGLVLDDRLHTGGHGIAGELGHLPLDPAGPVCTCGARGCLEALAGDAAICGASGCTSVAEAMEVATGSDPAARRARDAFASAGSALGRALAGLCNLVDPELVIIAGESAAAYELMEPAVREALAVHGFSGIASQVRIEVDPAQADLWTRGAATLAIRAGVGQL